MTSSDRGFDLELTATARDRLVDLARDGAPAEICGVLAGDDGRVTTVEPVPNVADTPRTRYELDPEATLSTLDRLEDSGTTHLGFYHSHPQGPPAPSRTDEAQAMWVGSVYCIVSLPGPEIGAWRWTGDGFERLRLRTRTRE